VEFISLSFFVISSLLLTDSSFFTLISKVIRDYPGLSTIGTCFIQLPYLGLPLIEKTEFSLENMSLRIQRGKCKTHHTVVVFAVYKILLSIGVGSDPYLFPFMGTVVDKIQAFALTDSRLPVLQNCATSGYLLDNTVPCI